MNLTLMFIWGILAILSFINPWLGLPLLANIVNITFGILNMLVIITWILSYFIQRRELKKMKELIEETNEELENIIQEEIIEDPKPKKKRSKGSKGR